MRSFKLRLVSQSNRKVYTVEIHVLFFWIFIGVLFFLLLFLGYSFLSLSNKQYLKTKLMLSKRKNKKYEEKFEKYKGKINKYDDKLSKLEEICDNVLILNSLPPAFKKKKNLSMGGRSLNEYENIQEVDNEMEVTFSKVELKMKVLKDNFYKIIDKMENSAMKWEHVPLIWPVEGWVSSEYGWRESPFTGKREFHTGLDIATKPGTPIRVAAKGYVKFSGWLGSYGKIVIVDHGFGYETRYGHLKSRSVSKGMYIEKGQKIGTLGNTGRSTAPHLHYEILKDGKIENPMKYLMSEDNKVMERVKKLYGK